MSQVSSRFRILSSGLLLLWLFASPAYSLDIHHYQLEIQLDAVAETITGSAEITLEVGEAEVAEGGIMLDFVGLEVTGVWLNLEQVPDYVRVADGTKLFVPGLLVVGQQVTVEVVYNGQPEHYVTSWGTWGMVFENDRVFTVNVTEGARYWFPCNDRLDDKATITLAVTVADPWLVSAPGALLAAEPTGTGKTRFVWSADWDLPTYLMHFSAAPYELVEEEHDGISYSYYLYPTDWEVAQDTLLHAHQAIELFTGLYGPYPFPKVGFDEINLGGAVEQPSCVSIGTQIFAAPEDFRDVVAHEMSHTWFQGVVTIADWKDLWLSEGMATYHEAIYHGHLEGGDGLVDYVVSLGNSYRLQSQMEGYFPLYDPNVLWGVTVYRKGAVVLHMLRYLMGEEQFQALLLSYLETYKWGNATTQDFIALAESVSGQDFELFFTEWVHGIGYPDFGFAWLAEGDGPATLKVYIEQRQPEDWTVYGSLPVELEATSPEGDIERVELLLDGRETFATFEFPFTVDKVTFDPDRWWLKRLQKIDYPVTAVDSIEAVEDTLDIVEQAIDSAGMPENIAEVLPEAGPELSVETVGDFATVPDSIEPSPPVPKKNKGCTASSSAPSTAILWLFLGLLSLLAGCRRQYKSFPVFDGQQGQQGQ